MAAPTGETGLTGAQLLSKIRASAAADRMYTDDKELVRNHFRQFL